MLFVLMRYAVGGGNFIEDRSPRCSNVATACALRAAWRLGGVSEADALRRLLLRQRQLKA